MMPSCREDAAGSHLVAKDSSGKGNDLPLISPPLRQDVGISNVSNALSFPPKRCQQE